MNIIEVKNLKFSYSRQTDVFKDLNLQVRAGSFLAIAGPNGSGKSTLLNLLCGLLKAQSGSIEIDSGKIESYSSKKLARKVAVVRQEFVPVFGFSVIETVMMPRVQYLDGLGFESPADRQIVNDSLEATDTVNLATRPLGQISGGEKQRVFIARALAQDTPILLLDEPTSFLDLKHQVNTYDLLKKMQLEKSKTIVVVTHDINLATQYCDAVLLLGSRGDYYTGTTEQIFSEERIETVFDVKGYSGRLGKGNFFLPLGNFAKDSHLISR
jgi:iron complex transport system ATP-binding protein